MCGIAGTLSLQDGAPADEGTLRRMLALLRHRGPDQFGILLDGPAGLGNARLSILDLATGQQPIANADGTLWIVFNGEIFNHLDLRQDLEARGHRFHTTCDTETVLHAYEAFGPDCLSRFNGQFAIAIWNTRDRSLFLARDRLGVRPVFYTLAKGSLVFASEIKAMLADPRVEASLDPVTLDQIFTYWSPLSPRTAFKGIQELPPGSWLLAKDGRVDVRTWWELDYPQADNPVIRDRQACIEAFRELLVDATRIRLRADVPVGAYLSGGLDSSTIAAILQSTGDCHLDTFSITFGDPEFDETPYQRQMAERLGTDHQVVHADHADIGRVFPDVVWHTEIPLLRTSAAPMFLLSECVRAHGTKVVLTGEGADEFLAGYDLFKEAKVRRFWARLPESTLRPGLLRKIYPWISGLTESSPTFLAAFFGLGLDATDDPFYSHRIRWRTTSRTKRFFSEDLARSAAGAEPPVLPAGFKAWDPLHQAQYLEISVFMSQYLLSSQSDRVAMAHSVEGRFPFLDHRLVDFCNRLPPTLKLRGLTEKYLLKEAARPWLPAAICDRPKQPFRAPIHRSFFPAGPLDYVRDLLSPQAIQATGLFKAEAVSQLMAKLARGQALGETDDMALVGILSTQILVHRFLSGRIRTEPLGGADDVKVVDLRRPSPGVAPWS